MQARDLDTSEQLCTFFVDDILFGVDVRHVQEVLRPQERTRVPLAPDVVAGLINLRGHIVTALDMRLRLGLEPADADRELMNVVVRVADSTLSLLVDEIGDVVEVSDYSFETTPATLDPKLKSVVAGVYMRKGELLLLLDPALAIQITDSSHTNGGTHGALS
ncbi:MAG: chemotaxis protein CheW [Myxococcota bacterium]